MKLGACRLLLLALLAPSCGVPAFIVSITIAPANPTLPCNYSAPLVATAHYSNGATQDVTDLVTWTVQGNPPATAAVSVLGVLTTGGVQGTALVTATSGLLSGSTLVTMDGSINELYVQVYQTQVGVGNNAFLFDPAGDLPPDGTSDGTEAPGPAPSGAWDLKGVQPRTFTTWVRAVGKIGDTNNWTNVTATVTWTLLDPDGTGTTVEPGTGKVTCGSGAGTVYIRAVLNSLVQSSPQTGTAKANGEIKIADAVLASVAIHPQNVSTLGDPHFGTDPVYLALGLSQQLKVTGTFTGPDAGGYCTTWDMAYLSNQTNFVTVDAGGVIAAVGVGSTTVRATKGLIFDLIAVNIGAAEVVYLEISPASASMVTDLNASTQFHAIAHFTDGSTQDVTNAVGTTWFVGSPTVVMVDSVGLVKVNMGSPAETSEVGATYSSTFIAPDGTPSTKVTCSDAGNPAQTAPAFVDGMGLPVNLNGIITLL